MGRPTRVIVGVAVVALVVGAFPAFGATAGAAKAKTSGKLTVEASGVQVLTKGASTFSAAKNKQKIRTGETVQTDATGLAQITFADGSLTRLDHNTVFTLEKLSSKKGNRQVEGTVSAGQTWNRVQKLSESDTFQQKGSGATAAVLGTAFVTKCTLPSGVTFKSVKTRKALKKLRSASRCQFTLIDGRMQLSSNGLLLNVLRGQSVKVDETGTAGNAETLAPDILYNDQWVQKNLLADTRAGLAEVAGQPTPDDLKYARIEGSWPVTLNVVGNTGFRDLAATRTRTYTVTGSCTGDVCTVTLSRQTALGTRVVPLTFSAGVYSGDDPDLGTQDCVLENGTVSVPNGLKNSGTVTFSPSAAVADNGLWRATGLIGTVTETATQVAGAPNQCQSGTATFSMTAAR
jgi:hypothetical protein